MRSMLTYFAFMLISFSVFAKTGIFETVKIKPSHSLIYTSSGSKVFSGEICFNKPIVQMFQSVCGNLSEISSEHKIKFFYPDLNTDVTSSVVLTEGTNGQTFSFEANIEENGSFPVFYAVVELLNESLITKVQLQKTLEAQIAANPNIDQTVKDQLTQVKAELLADYPVAVYEWPLLRNIPGTPTFKYTTHSKKYRVSFELDRGDSFAGETNKLTYSIHSLITPYIATDGYVIGVDNQEIFNDFIQHQDRSLTGVVNLSSTAKVRSAYARVTAMGSLYSWKTIPFEFLYPNYSDAVIPKIEDSYAGKSFGLNQKLSLKLVDQLGRIKHNTLTYSLKKNGSTESIPLEVVNAVNEINKIASDERGAQSYTLRTIGNSFSEGEYSFTISAKDFSNNHLSTNSLVLVDGTPASIQLGVPDNFETSESEFSLDFSVFDLSDTEITVWQNGILVYSGPGSSFQVPLSLLEGANLITINVVDSAGNTSSLTRNIFRDSTPPGLESILPADGQVIYTQHFLARGVSNETLLEASINNVDATITKGNHFEANIIAYTEGEQTLNIRLVDLQGNVSNFTTTYHVAMPLMNIELVTTSPGENDKVRVTGLPGSIRNGATVTISTGFFDSHDITPNEDGSWSGEVNFSNAIQVTAKDDDFDYEETYNLTYNVDTTLSGVIKDPSDTPLPGVTVRIVSSGQSAVTNAAGVFSIANPALGDQDIKIDGSTIPVEVTNQLKEYSSVFMKVAIGNRQQNVIDRPIYISPKITDGTEVQVVPTAATTVQTPHAPGVILEIPAGKATFPGGSKTGTINISEIPAEKTSVEMPDGVKPEKVYALEPSGLKFTERVKLTLPNENDYPEGIELVILSKNSETGLWEVDGSATVGQSGSIETKPGMGISHFSEVFAVPFGLEMTAVGDKDKPGIDNQVGNLTTAVSLPSYQRLGNSIEPKLIYKSQWASPFVTVSNLFHLPRKHIVNTESQGVNTGFFQAEFSQTVEQWLTPETISTQFSVGLYSSPKYTFSAEKAPEKAAVTYGVDLSEMETGLYPSRAEYELKFRSLVISTTKQKTREFFGKTKTKVKKTVELDILESIFPPELRTFVYHQNKIDSEFGAGWKLAINQRIVNPQNDRLMIENEDGSLSTYTLQNTVETLVHDEEGIESLSPGVNSFYYVNKKGQIYSKDQNLSSSPTLLKDTQNYTGTLGVNTVKISSQTTYCCKSGISGCTKRCPRFSNLCEKSYYSYNLTKKVHDVIGLGGDHLMFLDQYGAIWETGTSESVTAGLVQNLGRVESQDAEFNSKCQNLLQTNCTDLTKTGYVTSSFSTDDVKGTLSRCGTLYNSTGFFPVMGFTESNLTASRFNKPLAMIPTNDSNVLIVADTGNNVVRKVFLANNSTAIVAGNKQTYDNGDGGQATAASLYHPQGLALDSLGNIYISTERGYIRKVTPGGVISTIAGKTLASGGQLVEVGPMASFNLSNPSTLSLDEENGYLYVADTGNHRIVQLDLIEGMARVVAGNGMCNPSAPIKEGTAALDTNICSPVEMVIDSEKNLVYVDKNTNRIRKIILNEGVNGIQRYASAQIDNTFINRNQDGTFERHYRDGTIAYFNSLGYQTSVQDLTGRLTTFNYDANNRLTSFTDPSGSVAQLIYSGDKISQFIDPTGRSTIFNHNGDGQLVEVQFPDSTTKMFTYDETNLMQEEVDQRGNTTSYGFNTLRKLATVTTPDNAVIELQDSTSKTFYNSYDGSSRKLVNYTDDNADGISDTIKNAKGAETTFVKETNGYVSKIIDAEDKETTIERDSEGRPTKITRPDSNFTQFTYDAVTGDMLARYESVTDSTESFTYNTRGQLTLHTSPTGKTTQKQYDASTGLLLKETDQRGVFVQRTYGQLGLVSSITNNLSQVQSYEYNTHGNLTRSVSPMGEAINYSRDNAGNVLTKTNAKNEVTAYSYDFFNRLLSVTTPSNQTTTYSYLPTGELTQILAPNSNVTTFEYNSMGRLSKKISPKGQITQLAYDQNGNVIQEIDPLGQVKTYEYNLVDQLVRKVLPDNEYNYTYTDSGKPLTISSDNSSFTYSYTKIHGEEYLSQISQSVEDIPTNNLGYSYNADGQLQGMTSDFISLNYSYNDSGKLRLVQNSLGQNFSFGYDASNRLTSMSLGGVLTTQNVFDANSFLSEIIHRRSGTVVSSFAYSRDANHNRSSMTTLYGTHNYQYDLEGQLVSASHPEGDALHALENFAYDTLGNRTSDNEGSFVYDTNKFHLIEDWKYIYAYDLNGNLVTKQEKGLTGKVQNFIYTSENQLTEIHFIDNGTTVKQVSYSYDALGRRVKKRILENNQETIRKYVYDSNEIIAELNDANEVLVRYTHSGLRTDDVLGMNVTQAGVNEGFALTSGNYFFLKDGLGSITEITNSTGQVVQRYAYSSFGKIFKIENGGVDNTANPDIKSPFTYTNREYDSESGLHYYRARCYDAHSGRFLQEDPDAGSMQSPQTFLSKYIYGSNNPISMTDPLGLFSIKVSPITRMIFKKPWDNAWKGLENVWNKNQAEIIATAVIIGAVSVGGPVAAAGLVAGGISAGFTIYNGGDSGQIAKSFIGGFTAGALTAGLGLAGAAYFSASAGASVAGGTIAGAAGGYLGSHANAQITRGSWASPTEQAFGIIGGALGGLVMGAFRGNVSGLDAGISTGTLDAGSSISGNAVCSSGCFNDAGTWVPRK